ncbi:hypothetical protein C8R46DRAFT_1289628 [Mycena filopes]|nr:hypothetical protein C8R46DRAFT_1289628 [Mycena filopes]
MPHRSLRLDSLSKLPASYRILADAAVNGTFLNLQEFLNHCSRSPFSRPKLFLPVFFANLDPARIPGLDQLDSPVSREFDPPVASALLSLRALFAGEKYFELQEEAAVDLWTRIWPWIHFLDTYREQLPEATDYGLFMATILDLQTHQRPRDAVDATPGVRVVVGRAWASFLGLQSCVDEPGFRVVSGYLLNDLHPSNPANIAELIDGVESTVDLALAIVRHMDHITRSNHAPAAYLFLGIIGILDKTHDNDALNDALLSAGIIKALVSMVRLLSGTTTIQDASGILNDCFTLLSRFFTTYAAPFCVRAAIQAGLLRAISTCAPAHPKLREHMEHLLQEILPPALVYYSVVSCVDEALAGVDVWGMKPRFKRLPLFADWSRLIYLAQKRAKIARDYDADGHLSKLACNNPACTNIYDKRDMKCCSACRRLNYCSAECQSVHWRQGGHRDVCARLTILRLHEADVIGTRDRSFMRYLVHHDYVTGQGMLLTEQVGVLYDWPDRPYYLVFDYTSGECGKPEILAIDAVDVPDVPNDYQAQWLEHVARAAASGGRMQVVIMRVIQDCRARFRMASMYLPSGELAHRLRRTADGLPPDEDFAKFRSVVREQVRGLRSLITAIV